MSSETPEARVKALADEANKVSIDPTLKAIRYVRSGKELIRSAQNYYDDGDIDTAYILYMRFLILSLEKIPQHPGYKELGDEEKKQLKSTSKRVLATAEKIKSELITKFKGEYEDYLKAVKLQEEERIEAERIAKQQSKMSAEPILQFKDSFSPSAPPPPYTSHSLASHDSRPLPSASAIKTIRYDYVNDEILNNDVKEPSHTVPPPIQPHFDRKVKPSHLMSPMGSDSLRQVVIPGDLISKFTTLASANTLANKETCGVLCGKIIKNQLVITHLVLPKQTGTPDSCTTLNEEEIYGIIDKYSLIQMGWIHTHPSQTSFLSSVDLHTHLSYQLMMPESIAVVVAPTKQESNVFTLTAQGMERLQKCTDSGFHPHPPLEEPYFTDADHATFDNSRYIIVNDLRFN